MRRRIWREIKRDRNSESLSAFVVSLPFLAFNTTFMLSFAILSHYWLHRKERKWWIHFQQAYVVAFFSLLSTLFSSVIYKLVKSISSFRLSLSLSLFSFLRTQYYILFHRQKDLDVCFRFYIIYATWLFFLVFVFHFRAHHNTITFEHKYERIKTISLCFSSVWKMRKGISLKCSLPGTVATGLAVAPLYKWILMHAYDAQVTHPLTLSLYLSLSLHVRCALPTTRDVCSNEEPNANNWETRKTRIQMKNGTNETICCCFFFHFSFHSSSFQFEIHVWFKMQWKFKRNKVCIFSLIAKETVSQTMLAIEMMTKLSADMCRVYTVIWRDVVFLLLLVS